MKLLYADDVENVEEGLLFEDPIPVRCEGEAINLMGCPDIYEGQRSFDLILRLNKDYTDSFEGIENALITTADGKMAHGCQWQDKICNDPALCCFLQ